MAKDLITLLSEDKDLILYRKSLRSICKNSVTATILLSQMMYRAERHFKKYKKDKFYKFKQPCKHRLYKEGDSWCEELGFSREEFDAALKKIGFKLGKTNKTSKESEKKREEKKNNAFIHYYTDSERLTWYKLNYNTLNKALNTLYLVECDSHFSKVKCDSHFTLNNTETTAKTTAKTSSKEEDGDLQSLFVSNESLIKGDVVNAQNNIKQNNVDQKDHVAQNNTKEHNVASSLEISDRLKNKSTKKNKPTKKIKQKYKHNNIVEKCYVQAVNAKATNHKRDKEGKLTQQAGIDTLDKIYALLNPKIQNPYYYANNVTEEYIDREWKSSEVIESFKFHMEHSTKDKQIRNFGNFILTTNYRERKSWSPLITWHAQMKKGITGTLDKDGEYFFKILNQNKVRDLDTLSAQTVNRIAKELNTLKESYELFEGTEHNMTYPSGIISVAAKYIKEKTNNTQYELVWINGKKFLPDFLKDTIKLNILKKKSKTRSREFA